MVAFTCNVCGANCRVAEFATEPPSCGCGSNVRVRALIHLLSVELFGESMPLRDFPRLRAIRGLGMTDKPGYASILAEKFDYANTYYDREPRLDLTEHHPERTGSYNFLLSSDVLEHIAPPVERAFGEACRLLKPRGFFAATVPCNLSGETRERFPELYQYRLVPLGGSAVLINRRRDGSLEIRDDLVFHGGPGAVLEMRQFAIAGLQAALLASGFREVNFLTGDVPEYGILFDEDVSQPFVARKERFALDRPAQHELITEWFAARRRLREQEEHADRSARQIAMASRSRWVRLGRRFGVGPDFRQT